jgi:hypothetical protein
MRILLILAALISLQTPSADAATVNFNWSYTDGGANTGSGTFGADFLGGVSYLVTSISGTANGLPIFGLDSYGVAGQFLYYPAAFNTDSNGIGFSVSGGTLAFNIYEDAGLFAPESPYYCGANYCLIGPGIPGTDGVGDKVFALTNFSVTPVATPLPTALPLFVTGLAMLGFAGRRKKRSATVPA